jgi:diaminopimelate decarboxylase
MTQRLPGSPELHRNAAGELQLEGVALAELAQTHGTPLYVMSQAAITRAVQSYQTALQGRDHRIHYAMKANSNLSVLRLIRSLGCGFDIVSGGELQRALAAGAAGADIIFSGVGKTRAEMRLALETGIACFNVESEAELDVLSAVAASMGLRAPVSLRVNPDVDPKTHPYISTGLKGNKFGVAQDRVLATYARAAELPGLEVVGIDCHIGSQITQSEPYLEAMARMLDLVRAVEAQGVSIHHLDFGGGLGIDYTGDTDPPTPTAMWAPLLQLMDSSGLGGKRICIEPGRSIVGNAGVCLTEVLFLKPGEQKNFCIVDAAMNDLPRPAMYQAYHHITAVQPRSSAPSTYDVVGPVCESGDWLGRDRSLALAQGDVLAVLSTGAYSSAMASNYNTRGRAAEVLVDGAASRVIRKREGFAEMVAAEQ